MQPLSLSFLIKMMLKPSNKILSFLIEQNIGVDDMITLFLLFQYSVDFESLNLSLKTSFPGTLELPIRGALCI